MNKVIDRSCRRLEHGDEKRKKKDAHLRDITMLAELLAILLLEE